MSQINVPIVTRTEQIISVYLLISSYTCHRDSCTVYIGYAIYTIQCNTIQYKTILQCTTIQYNIAIDMQFKKGRSNTDWMALSILWQVYFHPAATSKKWILGFSYSLCTVWSVEPLEWFTHLGNVMKWRSWQPRNLDVFTTQTRTQNHCKPRILSLFLNPHLCRVESVQSSHVSAIWILFPSKDGVISTNEPQHVISNNVAFCHE